MDHLSQIIEQYGIYAVYALCTVEGDMTLLISGVMAHGEFFGHWGFFKVFLAGTLGGMSGDMFGYWVGRIFHENAKHYRFYQMAQPRVQKLIDKFGGSAIIISKYIYGIRVAMCLFYGVGRMPFLRFLMLDAISCSIWVLILAGAGYFFSGAITSVLGNFKQAGIALFFIALVGIVIFYLIEHYWLSEKVEEVRPETIHRIEEKLLKVEEAAQTKLHDIGEKLHLTSAPNRDEASAEKKEKAAAAKE
ncbi:MAG TPA: DedA family protein [Pyrinomonadaceae bacterium]|jgi:membrane protein DedA with SNARE-associated domain